MFCVRGVDTVLAGLDGAVSMSSMVVGFVESVHTRKTSLARSQTVTHSAMLLMVKVLLAGRGIWSELNGWEAFSGVKMHELAPRHAKPLASILHNQEACWGEGERGALL